MVVDAQSAANFIAGYKSLLIEVNRQSGNTLDSPILELLATAREVINDNPATIAAAAEALESNGLPVAADVLSAIKSLRLKQWVFLRDTTAYSVFVDGEADAAYAVLGLTNRIRDLVGGSAVVIKTGMIEYRGRYVCDGLIGSIVWLGSNLKRDFNAAFSRLKKKGRFHLLCEP